jgi:hypothetical protein
VFEHCLSVAGQVFGVDHRKADVVLPQEIGEHLLALDLREFAEIPVPPEEIKGVEHQSVLTARGEFGLQLGKIGPTFVDDYHLPVDDRLIGNIQGAGN